MENDNPRLAFTYSVTRAHILRKECTPFMYARVSIHTLAWAIEYIANTSAVPKIYGQSIWTSYECFDYKVVDVGIDA